VQKVAAYRLERGGRFADDAARRSERDRCLATLQHWLEWKGIADPEAEAGNYAVRGGGTGTFARTTAQEGNRTWTMLRLDEDADGLRYAAAVSITDTGEDVIAYATLEAGPSENVIKPVRIDPHGPRIIRDLLALPGEWSLGLTKFHPLRKLAGTKAGIELAAQVVQSARTIPLVVLSKTWGETALPGLEEHLAHDLAGLANVVVLDEETSWGLTNALGPPQIGKRLSCYSGAVRVYWPKFTVEDDPFAHPLWTADRLRAFSPDPAETRELFRFQLRRMLMQASALSVPRPAEIDAIRDAARTKQFDLLKLRAKGGEGFEEFARDFDNELAAMRRAWEEAVNENRRLSEALQTMEARLAVAESSASFRAYAGPAIAPEGTGDAAAAEPVLQPGDITFYKKVDATERYDKMVRRGDCGHNHWQGAFKADKAEKGIERLEGRSDWKSIQHCASCTGGGVWRVRW
jgi:hypothetical protein